jgi:redox-sensing transcriptional repressor
MNISKTTLNRLPQYLRILKKLKKENVENISSTTIAEMLKLNSIQVRKDLALVSHQEGRPGIGFNVDELINDLEEVLGLGNITDAIIVGAGRLGQALLNYSGFEGNFNIVMAFDNDKKKCNNKNIFHIKDMKELIEEKNIKIGIITVQRKAAQEVCDLLVDCGIKAIWNFAPVNLIVPEDVIIKNEDLSASLMILSKRLHEKNEN